MSWYFWKGKPQLHLFLKEIVCVVVNQNEKTLSSTTFLFFLAWKTKLSLSLPQLSKLYIAMFLVLFLQSPFVFQI